MASNGNSGSRLLEIDPSRLDQRQTEVLQKLTQNRGRVLAPYKVWIHSPVLAEVMEPIGTYLNKNGSLDYAEVETAILVTAYHWQSPFVISAHIKHGRQAGLDERALECLSKRLPPVFENEHAQAVYDFAAAAVAGNELSDSEFERFERILGRKGIAELLILVGYYTSVALAMKMHRVPPPPE